MLLDAVTIVDTIVSLCFFVRVSSWQVEQASCREVTYTWSSCLRCFIMYFARRLLENAMPPNSTPGTLHPESYTRSLKQFLARPTGCSPKKKPAHLACSKGFRFTA